MPEHMPESRPIKLSAVDEDILTALLGREMYGLELLEVLNQERSIPIGFSSLYPGLQKLILRGFLDWRWGDESEVSGGARRKYFSVSSLGEKKLWEIQKYRESLSIVRPRPT